MWLLGLVPYHEISNEATRGTSSVVKVYADMLQVRTPFQGKVGGGQRGTCKGFSDASRRRLMYKLAQWSLSGCFVYFVTLTYPEVYASDWTVWKRDLQAFIKVLKRKYPQALGMCWRVEFQRRGAPHFHLIVACSQPLPTMPVKGHISRSWARIVKDGYVTSSGDETAAVAYSNHFEKHLKAGTQIKTVDGRKQLKRYVSKYVAKSGDPVAHVDAWGRSWGFDKLNAEGLDFEPLAEVTLTHTEAALLRRMIRNWAKGQGMARFSRRLARMVSYSILGLGVESNNSDLAYKLLAAIKEGLLIT